MPNSAELLEVCRLAARAGAEQLLSWRGRFETREKGARDFVTDADIASEKAVCTVIAQHFPSHAILGEESAAESAPAKELLSRPFCWVIDPLDGTTNYLHQFPCFGVSVAVAADGILQAGVIIDPLLREEFAASRGGGATLNGAPLQVSDTTAVESSLVAISFPPNLAPDSPDLQAFLNVATQCRAVRRTGSAALNLAYVASSRLDAHWAHQIHPWDAAAGVLLVQEAGGMVTASRGGEFDLAEANYFACSNVELHKHLMPLVKA
ncbi:inositol monophosphatase family protein [Adhaeretor mobilis]|uniref:Inositol-1-monophosphatase n=1 Tax=Adhaeretor mobilis TaxID=1930276 RepID=A0A517MR88_9BACT|nr:inositol monophosphatase family protein [Adhaeretor mobilis]QDS97379.1 Inositol-1-monophosphatase [Adhaeretor mobilis]